MKLNATTFPQADQIIDRGHDNISTVQLRTEPNSLKEFIEIQAADMGDGSINIVIFGTIGNPERDSRGNPLIRVWPTTKPEPGKGWTADNIARGGR